MRVLVFILINLVLNTCNFLPITFSFNKFPELVYIKQYDKKIFCNKNSNKTFEFLLNLPNKKFLILDSYNKIIEHFTPLTQKFNPNFTKSITNIVSKLTKINKSLVLKRTLKTNDKISQTNNQQIQGNYKIIRKLSKQKNILKFNKNYITDILSTIIPAVQATTSLEKSKIINKNTDLSRMKTLHLSLQHRNKKLKNIFSKSSKFKKYLKNIEELAQKNIYPSKLIRDQLRINRELADKLYKQINYKNSIILEKKLTTHHILNVRQILNILHNQTRWISDSKLLRYSVSTQINQLPEISNFKKLQQVNHKISTFRAEKLHYQNMIEYLNLLYENLNKPDTVKTVKHLKNNTNIDINTKINTNNYSLLSKQEIYFLKKLLKTEKKILHSLYQVYNDIVDEILQFKNQYETLDNAIQQLEEESHRYLFWNADLKSIEVNFPIQVIQDLTRLTSIATFKQLENAMMFLFSNKETLFTILTGIIIIVISEKNKHYYKSFIANIASKIGKVTHDNFQLTLRAAIWSIIMTIPPSIFWVILGCWLQQCWPYEFIVALGDGIIITLPLFWICMIVLYFAKKDGIFLAHFRWAPSYVSRMIRYSAITVIITIPLAILLTMFSRLENLQFLSTLGRFCFILICYVLSIFMLNLKCIGISFYYDPGGNGYNIIDRLLWNTISAFFLAISVGVCVGYLSTALTLLSRLQTSAGILFFLLLLYHFIRRWMLIQRRRIAFDRARQRRADILASRARSEEEKGLAFSPKSDVIEIEEPIIDLDIICAQSLQLVRALLTLISIIFMMLLWSEIHSVFNFLNTIELWDASITSIQGIKSVKPITVGTIIIAAIVLIITIQIIRNMPALLEFILLQHINVSIGTGYTVTTMAKYLTMIVGGSIGCSIIGIDWSKLQWLIAALGIGLGFGLQEIFANFISGLIILFERPIRLNDTVTIRDLTGSITKINTRATTITDWDRKEIIVPNRAFITEQFINWSLSDSVTRVVLTIPVPPGVNIHEVTEILKQAAEHCIYVLDSPPPEIFLVDLQHGIQLFELRVHAAEMGHRMPLRHELNQLILQGFEENNIEIPFPPFQVRMENTYPQFSSDISTKTTETFNTTKYKL